MIGPTLVRVAVVVFLVSLAAACGETGGQAAVLNLPTGTVEYLDPGEDGTAGDLIVQIQATPDQLRLQFVEMQIVSAKDLGYVGNMKLEEVRDGEATYVIFSEEAGQVSDVIGVAPWTHTITIATFDGRAFATEVVLDPLAEAEERSLAVAFEIVDIPVTD